MNNWERHGKKGVRMVVGIGGMYVWRTGLEMQSWWGVALVFIGIVITVMGFTAWMKDLTNE